MTLDDQLRITLQQAGFTGKIESTLVTRLGRPLNPKLIKLGQLLFFDKIGALHSDNSCGGCHAPSHGFGDTQSIAIGIQNNNIAGPNRKGPRNQRRTPSVVNTAFYPGLMWNTRFSALSGDPFDNSQPFLFPSPEGITRFPANDPVVKHLLIAQAHIPPTETVEVAGFTGTKNTSFSLGPRFDQFDDGLGSPIPAPDPIDGFRNEPIRQAVLGRLNASVAYKKLFGDIFPTVKSGSPIDFKMFGQAIAEFEFTLVFANAPVDRFARGENSAMSTEEKRGALIFFVSGKCVQCHAVGGKSNEMFSDFKNHVIAVPQIAPFFGVGKGNVIFDGVLENEDEGLKQFTGQGVDIYKFRTSPLRNAALQPAFFHNGAFTRLEDAIRHHLDVRASARGYNAVRAGIDKDLTYRLGPIEPVLARLDLLLAAPIRLSQDEFESLVKFVKVSLLDSRANRKNACAIAPASVPSGMKPVDFELCHEDDK